MKSAKRILLVRHGETDWNKEQRIQGTEDVPLNAMGLLQADDVARALAVQVSVATMVSSDLVRTRQTSTPIADSTGFSPQFDARLRERNFGVWQGKTYAEWQALDAEGLRRYEAGDENYGPEGGETAREFYERSVNAITDLALSSDESTLLIVTHGGVVSSLYRKSENLGVQAARTWSVPNASISEWHFDGAAFHNLRIGDITHLAGAIDEITLSR